MTAEARAIRQAHLQQASVHIVDAIANIQASADQRDDVSYDVTRLKEILGRCTAEILYLQRQQA